MLKNELLIPSQARSEKKLKSSLDDSAGRYRCYLIDKFVQSYRDCRTTVVFCYAFFL